MAECAPENGRLYAVPQFAGADDYISDLGVERIAALIERLPKEGFDVPNVQASTKGVTATLHFEGRDPMTHAATFDAMLHAVTVVRTLHANLVAARQALASDGPRKESSDG